MTSRTISQLPATASVAGDEAIPFAKDGANGRMTPARIADHGARKIQRRPLRIAFAGDSIAYLMGLLRAQSPFFWSQARHPRRWECVLVGRDGGVVAVSGSKSGEVRGPGGTVTHAAIDDSDMNTPAMIARLTAWQPDVLVIEVGTNDSAAPPDDLSTFRNTRAVVEAVGARHTILFPILPRNGWTSANFANVYNALLLEWERTVPGIHVIRADTYMADSVTGVLGGDSGAAGAMTAEGLHPSATFGRALEQAVTALLDQIGAPRIAPRAVFAPDIYTADRQGLNVIGSNGQMGGAYSSSFVSAPSAGVIAPGWQLSVAGNAELILTGSKDSIVVRGATYDAQKFVASSVDGAALTANRTATFKRSFSIPAGDPAAGEAQAVVRIKDPVGIYTVSLEFMGTINGVAGQTIGIGAMNTRTEADLLPSDMDETLEYMIPGSLPFDRGTTVQCLIKVEARTGMVPSAEIWIGLVGYHLQTGLPE